MRDGGVVPLRLDETGKEGTEEKQRRKWGESREKLRD